MVNPTVEVDPQDRAARRGQMDMDFLKIVKSIEELLYEVMAWLVFYPKTLWRVIAHPSR